MHVHLQHYGGTGRGFFLLCCVLVVFTIVLLLLLHHDTQREGIFSFSINININICILQCNMIMLKRGKEQESEIDLAHCGWLVTGNVCHKNGNWRVQVSCVCVCVCVCVCMWSGEGRLKVLVLKTDALSPITTGPHPSPRSTLPKPFYVFSYYFKNFILTSNIHFLIGYCLMTSTHIQLGWASPPNYVIVDLVRGLSARLLLLM